MTTETRFWRGASAQRLRAVFGGAAGNFVEWFDWFLFVSFALYFSPIFFPPGDRTVQLLQAAAVLASGFLVRPLGAWIMGIYADRRGRRAALSLSVALMCLGSLIMALTPGYDRIGALAPAALLMARLLQGLSVGGEYGASATYISEMAGSQRRGFWSSFQCVTLVLGQLAALTLLLAMQALLPPDALADWGWRAAFLIGAALAIVVFWIRRELVESHVPSEQARRNNLHQLFVTHWRETLLVFLLTAAGSTGFYVYIGYSQKFLVNSAGFTAGQATAITALALVVFLIAQPLFGLLSDVVGRRRTMIGAFLASAVATVPVMTLLSHGPAPAAAWALLVILLLCFSGYSAIGAVVKAELYPPHIRALGVGLPYALANATFGGTGEFLALWFKRNGHEPLFFWYLASIMIAGAVVAFALPETRKRALV